MSHISRRDGNLPALRIRTMIGTAPVARIFGQINQKREKRR